MPGDDLDLFGRPLDAPALTPLERKRMRRRAAEAPRGYVMPPGGGPTGETCGSCVHSAIKTPRAGTGNYWGCLEFQRQTPWTRGPRTDIRVRSPACSKWRRKYDVVPE
jgi:hypothetical protein